MQRLLPDTDPARATASSGCSLSKVMDMDAAEGMVSQVTAAMRRVASLDKHRILAFEREGLFVGAFDGHGSPTIRCTGCAA